MCALLHAQSFLSVLQESDGCLAGSPLALSPLVQNVSHLSNVSPG
jgi:hypothetical protein